MTLTDLNVPLIDPTWPNKLLVVMSKSLLTDRWCDNRTVLRRFGPTAPFGAVAAINPALIILLVPLFTPYVEQLPVRFMLLLGSTLAAVSYFCAAALPTLFGICLYSAL